jgi:riboflavin kinase/FMN adenylyltransferase
MKVIYNSNGNAFFKEPKSIGLGNFDGLHIGHMVLVNTLIAESRLFGLKSMIYTFTKHPENILRKKLFTPLLTTEGKKIELLRETSLDYLFFEEFDESFSRIKPESFVKDILVDRLNIKIAIAGFDYRFGYRGQGNTNILQELGKLYNFKVIVIPPVKLENEIVSSTIIRDCVANGHMDRAFRFLGSQTKLHTILQDKGLYPEKQEISCNPSSGPPAQGHSWKHFPWKYYQ